MTEGSWVRIGAVWGFLAVAMGAFGAHGLKQRLTALDQLANFHTAAQYHMYMALAMVAVGLLQASGRSSGALNVAGWSFLAGSTLFSGSLYLLSVTGFTKLGAVTPFGGLAILVGWAALAVGAGGSAPMKTNADPDANTKAPAAVAAGHSREF